MDDLLIEMDGEYYLIPWGWKDNSKMHLRKVASVQWAKEKIKGGYEVEDYMYIMFGVEKNQGIMYHLVEQSQQKSLTR